MKCLNNWVAIRHTGKNQKTASGIHIYEDSTKNYRPNFGEVIGVPDRLLYYKKEIDELTSIPHFERQYFQQDLQSYNTLSMPHDTDIEIKVGDKVFFFRSEQHIYVDDIVFVMYDKLICKDDYTPLNGYLLVEPEKSSEVNDNGLFLGYSNVQGIGTVIKEGSTLRSYLRFGNKDFDESLIGQKIKFRKTISYKIEHDYYRKGKEFIPVQRKDVLCKV